MARRFQLRERLALQLRLDAFNLNNHVNFSSPATGLTVAANGTTPYFNSPGCERAMDHLRTAAKVGAGPAIDHLDQHRARARVALANHGGEGAAQLRPADQGAGPDVCRKKQGRSR